MRDLLAVDLRPLRRDDDVESRGLGVGEREVTEYDLMRLHADEARQVHETTPAVLLAATAIPSRDGLAFEVALGQIGGRCFARELGPGDLGSPAVLSLVHLPRT